MSSDIAEALVDVFVEAMVTAAVAAVAAVTVVVIAAASVWQGLSCGCWLLCVEAPGAGGGPPLGRHFGKSRFKSAFSKIRLVIATAHSCLAAGCPFSALISCQAKTNNLPSDSPRCQPRVNSALWRTRVQTESRYELNYRTEEMMTNPSHVEGIERETTF